MSDLAPGTPTDTWTVTNSDGREVARVHGETIELATIAARELDKVRNAENKGGGFGLRRLRVRELAPAPVNPGL